MRHQMGFTLIEALFISALVGLFFAFAVPAFDRLVEQTRANTVVNRLQTELAFARSEAVFRRRQVTVCRSTDGHSCTFAGAWSAGMVTFVDLDLDEIRDPHEPILRVLNASDYGGLHLVDVGRRRHVSFRADGRSAGTNVTLKLCSRRMAPMRLIVVNIGGRVRIARPAAHLPRCGG